MLTDTLMVIRAVLLLFNPDLSASLCLMEQCVTEHSLCLVGAMTCLGTSDFLHRLPRAVDTVSLMYPADGPHAFPSRLWHGSVLCSDLPVKFLGGKVTQREGRPPVAWYSTSQTCPAAWVCHERPGTSGCQHLGPACRCWDDLGQLCVSSA